MILYIPSLLSPNGGLYRREGFIHTGVFHPCARGRGLVKDPGLLSLLLLFRGLGPYRLHLGIIKIVKNNNK